MTDKDENHTFPVTWKFPAIYIVAFIVLGAVLLFVYKDAIKELLRIWEAKEEYSYGYMVPFISAFLIWQRKDQLEIRKFRGSWAGVFLVLLGVLVYFIGELSALYLLVQYSLVILLMGAALALMGWDSFRIVAIPTAFLFFMIPLPQFFLTEISQQLQFISSWLGVVVIRLFDISVFLEGNIIDLGSYKLQVVEACSGLRYLFPLMTLGFMMAYFFNASFWKKAVIFFSTIPITILMNSFRIGAIGVMVEYWGIEMAEGFLHDFEGWVIFMACMVILFIEMWLLARIGRDKRPLMEVFGIDMPSPTPKDAEREYRKIPLPFILVGVMVILVFALSIVLPEREEIVPERLSFSEFPLQIDRWKAKKETLESIILDELKLNDYIMADYSDGESVVNFYVAYYDSQRKGQSAHSPRTCLPGGGWKINEFGQITVDGIGKNELAVNRVVIAKGEYKQLVYYWFQGRGRNITNEYLVKWFIFWDSLVNHRTDGALVRLTTFLRPGQGIDDAEKTLREFMVDISPVLDDYIPAKKIHKNEMPGMPDLVR